MPNGLSNMIQTARVVPSGGCTKNDTVNILSGETLKACLLSGCAHLSNHWRELNSINVFPIPDGDTGTNMKAAAVGMERALKNMGTSESSSAVRVMSDATNACILSGRGNSGTLLSYFFGNLAQNISRAVASSHSDKITAQMLTEAMRDVGSSFSLAMEYPQEGTMISVVRHATACKSFVDPTCSLSDKFGALCGAANEALQRTPDDLVVDGKKILRTHFRGRVVVDSGAQGIVYFFEGMHAAARGNPFTRNADAEDSKCAKVDENNDMYVYENVVNHEDHCDHDEDEPLAYPKNRFCTECIFTCSKGSVNVESLRQAMRPLGDSIVPLVVPSAEENSQICKVHIHTNAPERVFGTARSMSRDGNTLLREKCEDMRTQVECNRYCQIEDSSSESTVAPNIEVIIYSSCDMPDTLRQTMQMIEIPAFINIDGKEYVDDGVDISKETFFHIYRSKDPMMRTAAPSALNIKRAFDRALARKGRTDAIWITPSFVFSQALLNNFKVALSLMPADQRRRCHIYDSKVCGPAEALMTLAARRFIRSRNGSARVEDLVDFLDRSVRQRTNVFFVLPTLKYAIRGGRLKGSKAKLGSMLNLLPIMSCVNGEIKPAGKVFGCDAFERAKRKMLKILTKRIPRERPVTFVLLHACDPYRLSEQEDFLRANFNVKYLFTAPLSCAIAVHSGPNGCGIGYVFDDEA